MNIFATAVEIVSRTDARVETVANLSLVNTGIVLRNLRVNFSMPKGDNVDILLPSDSIMFYNVFHERAFSALAVQAVLLFITQEEQKKATAQQKPGEGDSKQPGLEWVN